MIVFFGYLTVAAGLQTTICRSGICWDQAGEGGQVVGGMPIPDLPSVAGAGRFPPPCVTINSH